MACHAIIVIVSLFAYEYNDNLYNVWFIAICLCNVLLQKLKSISNKIIDWLHLTTTINKLLLEKTIMLNNV